MIYEKTYGKIFSSLFYRNSGQVSFLLTTTRLTTGSLGVKKNKKRSLVN
uniref:Uncharacterized protein n=1 Tax=Streptococcus dysgalactiae subsp. equisimilis TaxID=119602 RepID=A0A0B5E578_STREQ|nr:hypothetical protein [Streptococcus dysgalactiae subsp. equisimilis]